MPSNSSLICAASIYSRYEVEDDWCLSVLASYEDENGNFPWTVGEAFSESNNGGFKLE